MSTNSTNSTIAIVNEDNSITGIYGHWDGHVETMGSILFHHYHKEKYVRELIEQGAMSSLGEDIKDCVFYHRDGFEHLEVYQAPDYETFLEEYGQEYNYLFINGEWVWDKDHVENTLKEMGEI